MPITTSIYGAAIATNILFNSVVSNFYHAIEQYKLPIQCPFKPDDLAHFSYEEYIGRSSISLKSGWGLSLDYGVLFFLSSPEWPADRHKSMPGEKITVTQAEALKIASNFVALTGLPPGKSLVFLTPEVEKARLPIIPFYKFSWDEPDKGMMSTAEVAVDSRNGAVVHAFFPVLVGQVARQHYVPPPDFTNNPFREPTNDPPPAQHEQELVKAMAADLRRWSARLGLPAGLAGEEAIRNDIVKWIRSPRPGQAAWDVHLRTPEGWELWFRDGALDSWLAPDRFYGWIETPDIQPMIGKWHMTERQAIQLVRDAVRDIKYQNPEMKLVLQPPESVQKPNVHGSLVIPRYFFEWQAKKVTSDRQYYFRSSIITAEVDAEQKKIKSLTIYFWEEGAPKIIYY
jgi:hypothetical protein